MRIALLLFLSAVAPAQAQQVYKCVRGAEVAYQSQPCGPTQRTVAQWDATADSAAPQVAAEPSKEPASSHKPPKQSRAVSNRNKQRVAAPTKDGCRAAKARRESKLKAVGLKRNFDLLRKLDDAVYEACR